MKIQKKKKMGNIFKDSVFVGKKKLQNNNDKKTFFYEILGLKYSWQKNKQFKRWE